MNAIAFALTAGCVSSFVSVTSGPPAVRTAAASTIVMSAKSRKNRWRVMEGSVQFTAMISHEIVGDDMQAVIMTLGAGDEVRAEAGAMTFMTDGIEMDARMEGGLLGGLKRKFLAGESLFLTFFKSTVASARVAFSGPFPGKIVRLSLDHSAMLCQRDAFLC